MNSVRTLFLSDIHLGTRACQAEHLLAFLKDYDCENLFLVGDIIDFWAMRRGVYWSAALFPGRDGLASASRYSWSRCSP